MPADHESLDDNHDIREVWVETDPGHPPITHALTLFDARACPHALDDPLVWHIFGGAETICGIVVSDPIIYPGHHIVLLEQQPEIDCPLCLLLIGDREAFAQMIRDRVETVQA
ncbi:MAG: hypothetical protein IIC73_06940 [Armatimonadetes bacterium]|nr:hypothetical protein [Armatimonadota bacterium]